MTEDDIIPSRTDVLSMAREAGLFVHKEVQPEIERFAALIASRVAAKASAAAKAEEREACAEVCETLGVHPALNVYGGGPEWYKHGKDCADAIRSRRNA